MSLGTAAPLKVTPGHTDSPHTQMWSVRVDSSTCGLLSHSLCSLCSHDQTLYADRCAPEFNLDGGHTDCSRENIDGIDTAFVLNDVLSKEEAASMVAMADKMGFERSTGDEDERKNGALSWVLHEELSEVLIRRIAPYLPWAVAVHSPGTPVPLPEELPNLDGVPPWVREIDGAPEGVYILNGLSARSRIYRYESDTDDAFLPVRECGLSPFGLGVSSFPCSSPRSPPCSRNPMEGRSIMTNAGPGVASTSTS